VVVGYDIAGVGSRLIAQCLDGIAVSFAEGLLFVAIALTAGLAGSAAIAAFIVVAVSAPIAYFTICEARWGQTLGKRAMRIRIVTVEGAPIGWRESLIRNVVRLIDLLPTGYLLGGIVAIWSPQSRRIGDYAAGTLAVRLPRSQPSRAVQTGSFAEAVEQLSATPATREGYPQLPPELIEVLAEYRRRATRLTPGARSELAHRLAIRLEAYHPRPEGMAVEDYVIRAANTYAPAR
jgi:uncharacterized RDD family membrane protein YckC